MASSSTPTATPRKRNPGRNLPAAFGTGIFLGGIVLFVVLGVPALTDNRLTAQLIWAVLVAILVVLALKEVLIVSTNTDTSYHLLPYICWGKSLHGLH